MTENSLHRLRVPLAVFAILLTWSVLYLPSLDSAPPYYIDEGYAVDLAKGWRAGHLGGETFLRPLAAYMPLHRMWIAWWMDAGTDPILAARFLSIGCALLVGILLFSIFLRPLGPWVAAGISLLYLSYDQTVVLMRMGIPHSVFSLGLLLLFLSYRSKWWTQSIGAFLCFWSHQFALPAYMAAGLLNLFRLRRLLALVITGTACTILYLLVLPTGGISELVTDMGLNFGQVGEELGVTPLTRLIVFWNYHLQDPFHLLVLAAALRGAWKKELASLGYLLLSTFLIWQRQNILLFNYPDAMLLGLAAKSLGDSLLAIFLFSKKSNETHQPSLKRPPPLVTNICMATLIALQLAFSWQYFQGRDGDGLRPRFHSWATAEMEELRTTAQWINQRSNPDDLILATPTIASQLHARTTDWLTATLYQGFPTTFIPQGWPKERFLYSLAPAEFRMAVISDSDTIWTLHQPNVEHVYNVVRKWPVVFSTGRFIVHANPDQAQDFEESPIERSEDKP